MNYFEEEDIDDVAEYSIEKWRRFIKIKQHGVVEIYVKHGRVSSKTIRKWHLNLMVVEGVTESIADFIQGRAPVTVDSAHYLNKVKRAKEEYGRIVGKFVI